MPLPGAHECLELREYTRPCAVKLTLRAKLYLHLQLHLDVLSVSIIKAFLSYFIITVIFYRALFISGSWCCGGLNPGLWSLRLESPCSTFVLSPPAPKTLPNKVYTHRNAILGLSSEPLNLSLSFLSDQLSSAGNPGQTESCF